MKTSVVVMEIPSQQKVQGFNITRPWMCNYNTVSEIVSRILVCACPSPFTTQLKTYVVQLHRFKSLKVPGDVTHVFFVNQFPIGLLEFHHSIKQADTQMWASSLQALNSMISFTNITGIISFGKSAEDTNP